jgi:hypothetical protein
MKPTQTQKAAIEALLRKYEPAVQNAFMQAIYDMRARIDLEALMEALRRKDVEGAIAIIGIKPESFWAMAETVRSVYLAAGATVATTMPSWVNAEFGFNGRHPRAEQWISSYSSTRIQGIADDQIAAVRIFLNDALQDESRGVRSVALQITGKFNRVTNRREGGILGLTSEQTEWVIRARHELHNYLTRSLRDKRYDKAFKAAVKEGRKLTQSDIDKITTRYKDRVLAYRGKTIAENETFTAQSLGRDESMQQLLESGVAQRITKKWIHGHSKKPRPDHRALDSVVKEFDEPFIMGDGTRMKAPHDPAGGAKHSVKCKCTLFYRPIAPKDW